MEWILFLSVSIVLAKKGKVNSGTGERQVILGGEFTNLKTNFHSSKIDSSVRHQTQVNVGRDIKVLVS